MNDSTVANPVASPADTTTYSVIVSTGCSSDTAYVTININPAYFINDTSLAICTGDSALIYGNYETVSGTYYDSLFTAVNGCDSVYFTVLTVNPVYAVNDSISIVQGDSVYLGGTWQTTAGVYYDTLTAMNSCDSIVATTLSVVTGINERLTISNDQITIYPNPTRGLFTISGNPDYPAGRYELPAAIELYDFTGRQVYRQHVTSNRQQIDVSELAKGLYVWSIANARGKIVLE